MNGTPTLLDTAAKQSVDPNRSIRIQRAADYPKQIWYFLASFIGLLVLLHVGALIFRWRRKRHSISTNSLVEGEKTGVTGEAPGRSRISPNVSPRRVPMAIVNTFRILTYRIPLPIGGGNNLNGAEIGVTAGYVVLLFTWEFVNCMNITTKVKLDPTYWANRAGNIVATQLPLMVALAGKNNIISLLTGISYEKLNVFHRAAARINLILVWVHFWGRFKLGLTKGDAISNPWVRTGIAVAAAYTLLVLISFRPLRRRFYELFFYSHFILVLMIIIGAYFHIRLAKGFGPYLIPTFVLWALDRTLRFARLLWNNQSKISPMSTYANAQLLSPTMVRLSLKRRMMWRAGQNAFITMPGVSRLPFEAHPFTIASIPHDPKVTNTVSRSASSSKEEVEKGSETMLDGENELVFFVKVREGFTKRLREAAERGSDDGSGVPLSVYVDGPYGSPPDVNVFESLVLIAGGSGISYTLPLLQDVVRKLRQGKSVCRNVLFMWVTPHRAHLSWVCDALYEALEAAPRSLDLRLRLYVTQDSPSGSGGDASPAEVSTDTKHSGSLEAETLTDRLQRSDRMSIRVGRPNIHAILEEELVDARGRISVDVAGPAELAADVRKALRFDIAGPRAILKGGPDISLHVETYGIA